VVYKIPDPTVRKNIGPPSDDRYHEDSIPDSVGRQHILKAIADLDNGIEHAFGRSIGYDVLYEGRRYPPKAVVGLAAGEILGTPLGPYNFKGGLKSKCFRTLIRNGFTIVTKGETNLFPDEVDESEEHTEGAIQTVLVNRYERDAEAREKSIKHYGLGCQVCDFIFENVYGTIGEGFIHVHHTVPLSTIGKSYTLDIVHDLKPVCPNCHAMLHKRVPPYTIVELRNILKTAKAAASPATARRGD
jgi:5-methylcytosine-specific restriction protein A